MKKISLILCAFLLLGSTALLADTADSIPFLGPMSPQNEVPPTTVNGHASAVIWAHVVRDNSGTITSGSVDFNVTFQFPGATNVTGLHIHNGPAGVNANIVIPTDISAANPVVVDATGKGTVFKQVQINTPALVATLTDMLANPQNYYVNIHTTENPGGAMRSQLFRAEMTVVMAQMSQANEVPPTGSTGTGVASVTVLRALDPTTSAFVAGDVVFNLNFTGFPADTTFTGFHIHNGVAGVNGPVIINTGLSPSNTATSGPTGSGSLNFDVPISPSDASFAAEAGTTNGLFDNPGNFYINIHTPANPGGEIRAQLRRTDRASFQVTMSPANETPPITTLAASAPAKVTVFTLRNSNGSIAAGTVLFDGDFRGFPAGTVFTGFHIHDGPAGVAGPVTINTGLGGGPNSVTTDTGNGNIFRFVTVSNAAGVNTLNTIVSNPENAYINLHTTVFPNGAVRSQLAPATTAAPLIGAVTSNPDTNTTKLAPGSIFTIFGSNLAKFTSDLSGFSQLTGLPTSLNGVSITVGGKAAPIYFISPFQINAQVPIDVPTGTQPVVVTDSNGASTAFTVVIADQQPALYFDQGSGRAAILKNSDFSLVTTTNRVNPGDIILLYSTGLGQTTPPLTTGNVQPGDGTTFNFTSPVTVTIGGKTAQVIYSIASPGFAGLYQTAVVVPQGVTGNVPVVLTTQNGAASNAVTLNVN
jgi:uncharacterized protein (TIGR03437 family)